MEHVSQIPLEGASNTRDLGWLFGTDDKSAGKRRVLRSANLDRLSPDGQRHFHDLGIAVVIDLRGKAEAAEAPDLAGTTRVHLPIEPNVLAELRALIAAGALNVEAAHGVMENTYRMYITEHADVFANVLHHVLNAKQRPLLFHCAAGKDRTGVAAALILAALGVRPSTIMEDYLLSNRLYRPLPPAASEIPTDIREAITKVRPSYLDAALATMAEGRGGSESYLERALGFGMRERAALREAFAGD
jgi:protein-tyrosine phosphatase